jgi:hypothetical protein
MFVGKETDMTKISRHQQPMKRHDDPQIDLQGRQRWPRVATEGGFAMAIRNVLIAVASTAVIAAAAGCGTSSTPAPTTSNTPRAIAPASASAAATAPSGQPSPAAGAQSACADLGGTVDPDQICYVHSSSSSFTLNFSFPVSFPDQQALTDYLTHERDQEVDYAAQFPPAPDRISWSDAPGRYDFAATGTAYRSGTPASGTQSLVFDITDDTGAANAGRPVTSYKAFNYDLSTGSPITFDTLFKPGTKPVDVQRVLEKPRAAVLPPFDDFGVHAYQNFAITDDAVIFFFDHDFLHEEGPREVSAPRTELVSLLA